MKTLQKGFSLVELLVVVAIIGVLAGVGVVGYQGYTEAAKERVAMANYNSVKRFIETELILLNNNIQTTSASIRTFAGQDCTTTVDDFNNADNTAAHNLGTFLRGIECYFSAGAGGYGNSFKNPYMGATDSQVIYNQLVAGNRPQGSIHIDLIAELGVTRAGVAIPAADPLVPANDQDDAATSVTMSSFILEYIPGTDGVAGIAGEQQGQVFTLN
jgi:type IV pilus assembly protein PilA